jgi:hypothetical protein
MNQYGIHYNRTTNHITGFALKSTDEFTMNTCGAVTRSTLARSGKTHATAADALAAARSLGGRRLCKNCERAALAQIELDELAAVPTLEEYEAADQAEYAEFMGDLLDDAPAVTAIALPSGVTMDETTRVLSGPIKHMKALYDSGTAVINGEGDLVLI